MNDKELVELVGRKMPEELTAEELELLRRRLADSPALREALADHLQLEGGLSAVLGGGKLNIDRIVGSAAGNSSRLDEWLPLIAVISLGIIFLLAAGLFFSVMSTQQPVAKNPPKPEQDAKEITEEEDPVDPDKVSSSAPQPPETGEQPPQPVAESISLPHTFAAAEFTSGNVAIDKQEWGTEKIPVIRTAQRPSFVEYRFRLNEPQKLRLKMEFATFESRPVELIVNGEAQGYVAGDQTGGYLPEHQKWFDIGLFGFKSGENVVRLASGGMFPHFQHLSLSLPPQSSPKPPAEPGPGVVAAAEPPPEGPWDAMLKAPVAPLEKIGFDAFDPAQLPQKETLADWLEPVPGKEQRLFELRTRLGVCGAMNGLLRLKSPWNETSALRLSLENTDHFRIHLFHGGQGVTLAYEQGEGYRWAGYKTTRENESPEPKTYFLTATDDNRNDRSEFRYGGELLLAYRQGEIILSRADLVLLRMPLAGPPTDVYFAGSTAFHGLDMIRVGEFPAAEPKRPLLVEYAEPAKLEWFERLSEGVAFEKTAEGLIKLKVENKAGAKSLVSTPLPAGLKEVVLKVSAPAAGFGVFLGKADWTADNSPQFARSQHDQSQIMLTSQGADGRIQVDQGKPSDRIVPLVDGGPVWIRLLCANGELRWWQSADGKYWGEPVNRGYLPLHDHATHIGIYCVGGTEQGELTLEHIALHELSRLSGLAENVPVAENQEPAASPDAELAARLAAAADFESWQVVAAEAQPEKAEWESWRRECIVAALGAGCKKDLGNQLLELLLKDAQLRGVPADQQLAALEEAALIWNLRHEIEPTAALAGRFYSLGMEVQQQGERPFSFVMPSLLSCSIATNHRFPVANADIIRAELFELLGRGKWEETVEFCRRLRFFQMHDQQKLIGWAEMTALRELPRRPGDPLRERIQGDWRHPLVEQLSKDAYNVLAELEAMLESDAYEDAARKISSLSPESLRGVAPFTEDRQLLVSLTAAIGLAMREYPQLQQTMQNRFGEIAALRVKQAQAQQNAEALELAAVQFAGTPAVTDAQQWLGDRALANGWFSEARYRYEEALRQAGPAQKRSLLPRVRLAAAMLGENAGQPVDHTVELTDAKLSAGEFESLVTEMQQRGPDVVGSSLRPVEMPAPKPAAYKAEVRGRFDGPVGHDPNYEATRFIDQYSVHWAARQIAVAREGNLMYVGNRFHIACYDMNDGRRVWQSQNPPANMLRSQEWTLTPMALQLSGDRIYSRMLYHDGPSLVCHEKSTGKLLWFRQEEQRHVVTDPMWLRGRLMALEISPVGQGESQLQLVQYDAQRGDTLLQYNLLRLRDVWDKRRFCSATVAGERMIVAAGGVVFSCDDSGNISWLREQPVTPTEEDSSWVLHHYQPPLVHEDRILITQPGVPTLECLAADSGALVWRRVLPDIRRTLGIIENRVIVHSGEALLAIDAASGETLWRRAEPRLLTPTLCGGEGGILVCRQQPLQPGQPNSRPVLAWIDPESGEEKGTSPLEGLDSVETRIGPFVPHDNGIWTFYSRERRDPRRDVIHLQPQGEAVPPTPENLAENNPWKAHRPLKVRQPFEDMFPQWTLFAANPHNEAGLIPVFHDQQEVIGLHANAARPVIIGRHVTLLRGSKPRLRIFTSNTDPTKWTLEVRFNGEVVESKEIDDSQNPRWNHQEVNLAQFAGRTGWLTIYTRYPGDSFTYWKRIDLLQ